MSDAAQRARIVEEARNLLVEKGYGRTTTDDIASHCRISKQTLYRHFSGKHALFAAIVDSHRHSMLALPGDYGDMPLGRALETIFRIDIDPKADKERVALLRFIMVESRQFPELEKILRRHGADPARAELAQWLAERARQKQIAIDDADSTALILMDMIFGAAARHATWQTAWPSASERRAHIRRCLSIFLAGVVPR
ncbi:MAG: TetR/AcrR family transcriptional regulator [Pseudolabrys sp.]